MGESHRASRKTIQGHHVIIYGRSHDEQQWRVIDEQTVDAAWDTVAVPFMLADPGKYDVKATTSKGTILAQSVVEIVQ
jgi:hypothetical protein